MITGKFTIEDGELLLHPCIEGIDHVTLEWEDNSETNRLQALWVQLKEGYTLHGESYTLLGCRDLTLVKETLARVEDRLVKGLS